MINYDRRGAVERVTCANKSVNRFYLLGLQLLQTNFRIVHRLKRLHVIDHAANTFMIITSRPPIFVTHGKPGGAVTEIYWSVFQALFPRQYKRKGGLASETR